MRALPFTLQGPCCADELVKLGRQVALGEPARGFRVQSKLANGVAPASRRRKRCRVYAARVISYHGFFHLA